MQAWRLCSTLLAHAALTGLLSMPGLPHGAAQSTYNLPSAFRTQAITVEQALQMSVQPDARVPLQEVTIAGLQQGMHAGNHTCSSIVNAYLQRIAAYNNLTGLNAVRIINPELPNVTRQKDAQLAHLRQNGQALPPLFCAPLLIKDNFDTAQGGMAATAGAVGLVDNFATQNAFVVQRVLDAGAVILGKANMGEFALSPDESVGSLFGVVRNPYDLDHTTSGSSGGCCAAVSANLAVAALGTDTGNSIRGPAAHCGLVGLRPSLGLTSRTGVVPARLNRDTTGPIARTVTDAALLLQAMAGFDPRDNLTSLSLQAGAVPRSYSAFLDAGGLRGARVGVLRQLSNSPTADPEFLGIFDASLSSMAQAGATVVDNFTIAGNNMGANWQGWIPGKGTSYGFWNVAGNWEDLWNCQAAFPADFDAYAQGPNRTQHFRSLEAIYAAGAFHPTVVQDIADALAQNFAPADYPPPLLWLEGFRCGCIDFWTDPCRVQFRQALVASMDAHNVSVVAYPTWSNPPALVGDTTTPDGNNSPAVAPHTGAPALTVPMGFSREGLPAGLQLIARPFDEGTLLKIGYAFEQATLHRAPSGIFPELQPNLASSPASGPLPVPSSG